MMNAQTNPNENFARLKELIADFNVAMLTTVATDGSLHSRPMIARPQSLQVLDGELWFLTHAHTHKAEDIERHPQVNVSYADPAAERYVSVAGRALLLNDRQKISELWDSDYAAWFSQGLYDRDLQLLRVSIEEAAYWDTRGSVMVQLLPERQRASSGQT
jgi:general stress protein 26